MVQSFTAIQSEKYRWHSPYMLVCMEPLLTYLFGSYVIYFHVVMSGPQRFSSLVIEVESSIINRLGFVEDGFPSWAKSKAGKNQAKKDTEAAMSQRSWFQVQNWFQPKNTAVTSNNKERHVIKHSPLLGVVGQWCWKIHTIAILP